MRKAPFETVTLEELSVRHDAYWQGALAALEVRALDADDPASEAVAEPVSFVLPYRAAMTRYAGHVDSCETCSEGSWMDQCPTGNRLSGEAADACMRQETAARSN